MEKRRVKELELLGKALLREGAEGQTHKAVLEQFLEENNLGDILKAVFDEGSGAYWFIKTPQNTPEE